MPTMPTACCSAAPPTAGIRDSRWNPRKGSFDEPLDKTTYTLLPDTSVNHVYTYHRASGSQPYQLAWLVAVNNLPLLRDELLTQQR